MDLPRQIHARMERLAEEGSRAFDTGNFAGAIDEWSAAVELLPEPRPDREAWTWLCTATGDALHVPGNFPAARQMLLEALNGPGAVDNPFVHFRPGQVDLRLRLRLDAEALDHLLKAYMRDGEALFRPDADGASALEPLRAQRLLEADR